MKIYLEKQKGKRREKNSDWQEPVTSPTQTLTQGGTKSLVYWTRTNTTFFPSFFTYDETNKDKLGKIKQNTQ